MSQIKDVSDTAFMVAAYRALETQRPDALFRDPLASRLAGEKGTRIVAGLPKRMFAGGWTAIIRTPVIDRFIQSAIESGVDTVLNLGAGLDTRPYRMDLPSSLRWVEVDYPKMIEHKEALLTGEKPTCALERIKMDLADVSARRRFLAAVAAKSKKVLVLTEGVVPYLRLEDAASLADDLRQYPAFHYWIVDYFSPDAYRYRERKAFRNAMANAPFHFRPDDYFGFFNAHGWHPKEIRYLPEEADRLGRPFPVPLLMKWWMTLILRFVPPERLRAFKTFAGFVLFEPQR